MNIEDVKSYITQLPTNENYEALEEADKDKHIFYAMKVLENQYPELEEVVLNEFVVAEQLFYTLDGSDGEFKKFIDHGVQSYEVPDVKVTFSKDMVEKVRLSPLALGVLHSLNHNQLEKGGRTGWLI